MKSEARSLLLGSVLGGALALWSGVGIAAPLPAGWSCTGTDGTSCGTLGPDGVVPASPDGGNYLFVSTNGAPSDSGLGLGNETNGARALSPTFSASAGDPLTLYFNYVTSDGAGYADYAWVRLLDSALAEVAVLFTARTTAGGDTVPGFGMPDLDPAVTLTPPSTPITANATTWSALGGSSGACYSTGCGNTGWIQMSYTIPADGSYVLEFGVVNWTDFLYDSGLAFDGVTIAGTVITPPTSVPAPAPIALLGGGLLAIGTLRRRKRSG